MAVTPDSPEDMSDGSDFLASSQLAGTSSSQMGDGASGDLDLQNPTVAIDLLTRAAQANLDHPFRQGATINLPRSGRLLMTGDLHDNRANYLRIVKHAKLDESPSNYLVIHELIHGEVLIHGHDFSIRMLLRAAALKLKYPQQVFHIQSNHELAQVSDYGGGGIIKYGVNVVEGFNDGMEFIYGEQMPAVYRALTQYIRSLPLAVRCPSGILCCHSLPGPNRVKTFDTTVLDRIPTDKDLALRGSACDMVWGRSQTRGLIMALANIWATKYFLVGHQLADWGYELVEDQMLILASDHEYGVCLPIDLDRNYTMEQLIGQIVPLDQIEL